MTLTARRLRLPATTLVASARESQNIPILRQSGADVVIPTAESGPPARTLAGATRGRSPGRGPARAEPRARDRGARDHARRARCLAGVAVAQSVIVLAVVRDGAVHRFDERSVKILQAGTASCHQPGEGLTCTPSLYPLPNGPEALVWSEVPDPVPAYGEVLVRRRNGGQSRGSPSAAGILPAPARRLRCARARVQRHGRGPRRRRRRVVGRRRVRRAARGRRLRRARRAYRPVSSCACPRASTS